MPPSITEAIRRETREVIRATPLADEPRELNAGHCRSVAAGVAEAVPAAKVYVGYDSQGERHFFIRHKGKWYDAERPRGVQDPAQLPFFGGERPSGVERAGPEGRIGGDVSGAFDDLF